jgi:signal transduction histidine kinase
LFSNLVNIDHYLYAFILLIAGAATAGLGIIIWQRKQSTFRWFTGILVCTAIWAIAYGMELIQQDLDNILLLIRIEYFGISFLPACWIIFVIKYTGKEKWLNPSVYFLVFLMPVLTQLMVMTNQWHHLHYESTNLVNIGKLYLLQFEPGPWYHLHVIYFYLMLTFGIYLVFQRYRKTDRLFRRQFNMILIGASIPWLLNLIYLLGIRPLEHLDLTPFGFVITAFTISYGLLRYKLFDLVPIARDLVISEMREGLLIVDHKFRVVDINRFMLDFLNLKTAQAIGYKLTKLFPEQIHLHEALQKKEQVRLEISEGSRSNPQIFEVSINPIYQNRQLPAGYVLLFWDITRHKVDSRKLEEKASELNESNQLKNKLFSVISHDLRSPLGNVTKLVEMLKKDEMSIEEFHGFLPVLTENLNYTSNLLENLLYWSKSQMNGLAMKKEKVRLGSLVRRNLELMGKAIQLKNIVIDDQVPSNLQVFADPDMLDLILRNLLSNAIKFSYPDGKISLILKKTRDLVIIGVIDSGKGIDYEVQSKIFRVNNITSPGTLKEKGAGIGLMLCKEFVEKHDGHIWLESQPGQGSSFYFSIPHLSQSVENLQDV